MDASVFRHLQVSLLPYRSKLIERFLLGLSKPEFAVFNVQVSLCPFPSVVAGANRNHLVWRVIVVFDCGGAGPGSGGWWLRAPKTRVSSKDIPHFLGVADAN
jgi:hypothetical protein